MLHAGLDLSRHRLDVHVLAEDGSTLKVTTAPPDRDGLRSLVGQVARDCGQEEVLAVIESMNGARFVHDTLELCGWAVEIADPRKVKGLAPLACKTDRIDAWVLAELSRRDLVPAIWLPDPQVRAEREQARFRLHLVKHRSALKNRIHASLMTFGHPCPVSDLFGVGGRELLERLQFPEPWRGDIEASLRLIDELGEEIDAIADALRAGGADHRYVPLLMTLPGVSWILAYTIAPHHGAMDSETMPRTTRQTTEKTPKVWLVTGAGSGFGRALLEAAVAVGDVVVAAARRTSTLDDLVAAYPDQVDPVRLDVTDHERINEVAAEVVGRHGRIDVLVNNAGRTHVGAVEETTDAELRSLFEVHLFGPAALVRAVLPHMRARRSGAIVQMSSMGGQLSFAGFSAYSATKFALEGLSEALADEVRPFGIKVLIVEPGAFRTRLFAGASQSETSEAYSGSVGPTR